MLPLAQILAGGYYRTGEAATKVVIPKLLSDSQRAGFERIDFTAIDSGFDGHSIPFSLIADITRHKPAVDYKLVPETEVRANRLIRFANRAEKISDTTSDLPEQYCKRVVKIKVRKPAAAN
jgi:hypothetical protein